MRDIPCLGGDGVTLVAAIAGLAGAAVIVSAWIHGIVGYNSKTDKPFGRSYAPLSHLVSSLAPSSTPHSTVFNVLLVVGALAARTTLETFQQGFAPRLMFPCVCQPGTVPR